ncbi:hypothetical protein OIDMADRAFT_61246 [Oidiodendron maius Zn]|uniref:Uncharacterized protein n=1 Tax=Oidiodendron maius (strain Zn) TaxID=913774 RepID=A0A0C3C4Z4_OIDMZ|nr:hypothetical protein OIDMADRAFT_61246 [Oidiodendron maius Zn]
MAPHSEDETLLAETKLANWYRLISDAVELAYHPLAYKMNIRGLLVSCGFVDIHEEAGRWYNVAFSQGQEAMSLAPLTRMYKWEPARMAKLCSEVKREIRSKNLVISA